MGLIQFPASQTAEPNRVDLPRLMHLCAENTEDGPLWMEFLRCVTPKIRCFIRGTMKQHLAGSAVLANEPLLFGGVQERDLLQNTILRLVENNCAAMKRFSGSTEAELFAYLAVITRSVVRSSLRMEHAKKRSPGSAAMHLSLVSPVDQAASRPHAGVPVAEKELLVREVQQLGDRAMEVLPRASSERDRLIFQLYFYEDLSPKQISQCEGIHLSSAGVEKVLERLKHRLRRLASTGRSEGTSSL
jgi:RNA polymerase sigma factor (sigma-70 family)